jgi:aldose 1-epimerase
MQATEKRVGSTDSGKPVIEFTLENARGLRVRAVTHGAALMSVEVPGASGAANVILHHPKAEDYEKNAGFFGCIVGRFANRIGGAHFTLDGVEHTLARNNGENHLHGGVLGFAKVPWNGKLIKKKDAAGVRWTYTSADGEEGYPGTLKLTAEYMLNEDGELSLEYWAVTDKATPVNITNHSYWNLAGEGSGNVLEQEIQFDCPYYLPVDQGLIPTGEVLRTAGTPFDFSSAHAIGRSISGVPGGYDHCLVMAKQPGAFGRVCVAHDPASGRRMEVWTTKPGVQFYTGNSLNGNPYPKHGAFCVETQYFPDSVNKGHFPSCILRPGETYHQLTTHKFSSGAR